MPSQNVNKNTSKKSNSTNPYLIGLIVSIVLGIILLIVALWWFLWRDADNPLIRVCTSNNQCLPNEICEKGVCNAITCTINSECNKSAGGPGSSYCIEGYCQTATCNNNTDCSVLGSSQVCTNFEPDVATPWINSMCVNTGTECSENIDCYGGNIGLICVKQSGQTKGVCAQCGSNSDCATGQVCSSGVCSECTSYANGTSDCTTGNCYNGACCANPAYNVNGVQSCTKGDLYDICVNDNDCNSSKCIYLGEDVKICGGGTQGRMVFSAGTKVTVGDPDIVAQLTCASPADPNDTNVKPFALDGTCTYYSSNSSEGSACGRPSYCTRASKSSNLLCNGNVTFSNPFAKACKSSVDCDTGFGCSNAGYCSKKCTLTSNCPAGFVCGSNGVCQYPSTQIVCSANNCSGSNWEKTCECPSGYICNAKPGGQGNCLWQNKGTNTNPIPPPPPFVINSVCARPATALPAGSNIATSNYCVSGFCSSNAGWINSVCVQDGDCLFLEGDDTTNARKSLVCTNIGTYNVCRGSTSSISR